MLTLGDKPFVIAEAATCHADKDYNERFRKAIRYVAAAADAGADAIKFQMFVEPIQQDMFCWIEGDDMRSYRWVDSCLKLGDWFQIKEYAEARGLVFLASVFQHRAVDWLKLLKVEATKVASRAAEKFPYNNAPEPFLISDGMSDNVPADRKYYRLQCEAKYPSTMAWNPEKGGGFSDHSGVVQYTQAAIRNGCNLIEVHFCVDPLDAGPDYPACLMPNDLRDVCRYAARA